MIQHHLKGRGRFAAPSYPHHQTAKAIGNTIEVIKTQIERGKNLEAPKALDPQHPI